MPLQRERPELVLASGSPARAMLLRQAGLRFCVQPAELDEDELRERAQREGLDASRAAARLAERKAEIVSGRRPEALVIGADQILVCEGVWFRKPEDRAEVAEQLRTLRGRTHRLVTAVACRGERGLRWSGLSEALVTFRDFSDAVLEAVLDAEGENILGSVGGYRLEGPGVQLCARVEGDYFSILGLPLLPLLAFLRRERVLLE